MTHTLNINTVDRAVKIVRNKLCSHHQNVPLDKAVSGIQKRDHQK
jgi:hypothetical protein